MKSPAGTVEEYLAGLPEDRRKVVSKLRSVVRNNIPAGFAEEINCGMIGFVVPLTLYPEGYSGDGRKPLPFINIASQKNGVSFYHLGLYADRKLTEWFRKEYESQFPFRLDMGKSCIRFRSAQRIPWRLIGELAARISVGDWIDLCKTAKRKKRR